MNPLRWFQLAVVLVLIGGGAAGVLSYRHMAARLATADARIDAAEKLAAETQRNLDVLQKEVVRRAEFDRALREARTQASARLDKVTHEDPVARDYLGERIPDSVRRAVLAPEVR